MPSFANLLGRLRYEALGKHDKGVVRRFLAKMTGFSEVVTVRSCRYGAVLRACQMAIDADLNEVIANVGNGVGR